MSERAEAPSGAARRSLHALLALGVLARLALAGRDLPYYSVDENEIVEQAAIFLAGDLCPSFYSYGPLVSYLLAGLYALGWGLMGLLAGWDRSDVIYRVVFEPTPFYAVARLLHAAADVAAVVLAARFGARVFGPVAGWAVLGLGAAPLLSLNSDFTIRNDTFQGLLALLALALAGRAERAPGRAAALAGAAAGLSLAVKPLQGLLLLPALFVGIGAPPAPEWQRAGWRALAARAVPLLILGVTLAASQALANPCSVGEAGRFWRENAAWIDRESPSTGPGWHFGWWIDLAGWPLALFAAAALAAAFGLVRRPPARVLLVYVVTVLGAYAFVGVRPYWYNAVLPAVLVLAGGLVARLARGLSRRRGWRAADAAIAIGVLLAAPALVAAVGEAWRSWSPRPSIERRPDRAAELWIEERIPSGSRLLVVGRHALGTPRLVAETPKAHGAWADHFMYGRGASRTWNEAFRTAYRRHRHSGASLYWITNVRRDYTDRWEDPVVVERMHEALPALARGAGARYVVTSSSSDFTGRWESSSDVRLLASFGSEPGARTARQVKVFELLPPAPGAE